MLAVAAAAAAATVPRPWGVITCRQNKQAQKNISFVIITTKKITLKFPFRKLLQLRVWNNQATLS